MLNDCVTVDGSRAFRLNRPETKPLENSAIQLIIYIHIFSCFLTVVMTHSSFTSTSDTTTPRWFLPAPFRSDLCWSPPRRTLRPRCSWFFATALQPSCLGPQHKSQRRPEDGAPLCVKLRPWLQTQEPKSGPQSEEVVCFHFRDQKQPMNSIFWWTSCKAVELLNLSRKQPPCLIKQKMNQFKPSTVSPFNQSNARLIGWITRQPVHPMPPCRCHLRRRFALAMVAIKGESYKASVPWRWQQLTRLGGLILVNALIPAKQDNGP